MERAWRRSTRSGKRVREWENEVMILNLNNLLISLHIHILHAWWPPATFLAITHRGNDIKANAGGDYGTGAICSYLAESLLPPPRAAMTDGCALAKTMCLSQLKIPTTSLGPNGAELRWGEMRVAGDAQVMATRRGTVAVQVPQPLGCLGSASTLRHDFFLLEQAKLRQLDSLEL